MAPLPRRRRRRCPAAGQRRRPLQDPLVGSALNGASSAVTGHWDVCFHRRRRLCRKNPGASTQVFEREPEHVPPCSVDASCPCRLPETVRRAKTRCTAIPAQGTLSGFLSPRFQAARNSYLLSDAGQRCGGLRNRRLRRRAGTRRAAPATAAVAASSLRCQRCIQRACAEHGVPCCCCTPARRWHWRQLRRVQN